MYERDLPLYPFHIEHIVSKKHHGDDDPSNLAWSCHECNFGKSSNLSGRDFITGRVVVLFNPGRQRWHRHFTWDGAQLVGPCRSRLEMRPLSRPETGHFLHNIFSPQNPFTLC
jgi:HNH endonuclease